MNLINNATVEFVKAAFKRCLGKVDSRIDNVLDHTLTAAGWTAETVNGTTRYYQDISNEMFNTTNNPIIAPFTSRDDVEMSDRSRKLINKLIDADIYQKGTIRIYAREKITEDFIIRISNCGISI